MQVIADLQIHSKYARAVSPEMLLPNIAMWAKRKGIGLMATGDWTHPLWFREIDKNLEEIGGGILKIKGAPDTDPKFLLATEVSCIYSQGGKGRRNHTLIWVPTLDAVRKISAEMTKRGCNLMSDGRPIIGLTTIDVAEIVFSIEPKAMVIPAHAWTPWFAVYGSMSGFNSLDEAFGPYAKQVYAVETGLSSNPSMNWQIKELDTRSILSFSDSHSLPKIGREATVFELETLSFDAIREAVMQPATGKPEGKNHIVYTIEFYPEEGKYHYTGHRACNIRWGPEETREKGTTCPVCGKPLTQGVVQRVSELAGRTEKELKLTVTKTPLVKGGPAVAMTSSKLLPNRKPFAMLVPLQEIIHEAIGSPVASKKTQLLYTKLTDELGGEFNVLLHTSKDDIARVSNPRIAEGVEKARTGDIVIDPGYDGVFGVVKIWKDNSDSPLVDTSKEQLPIF